MNKAKIILFVVIPVVLFSSTIIYSTINTGCHTYHYTDLSDPDPARRPPNTFTVCFPHYIKFISMISFSISIELTLILLYQIYQRKKEKEKEID